MLVRLFNVVKVESVPLKSENFSGPARRTDTQTFIGHAGAMDIRRAAAVLAIATAFAAVAATATAAPASDEDQIRAVLNGMNGSYNRSDFAGFAAHVCADMLSPGFELGWYQSRRADGPTQITINSVDVADGDAAVANVRFRAANHTNAFDVEFLREGDEWKACRYRAARSI
jgi:hypothetical protein